MLAGLFTYGSGLLTYKWSQNLVAGVLVAGWMTVSPHLFYFTAQYPKNLLGLCTLLFALSRLGRPWWELLIALLICFLGHKLSFGLALLAVIFYQINLNWSLIQKNSKWVIGAVTLTTTVFFFVPQVQMLFDSGRLAGEWSVIPQFSPWSFISTMGKTRVSSFWILEIALCTLLLLLFFLLPKHHNKGKWWFLCLLLLFLFFPFLKWSFTGFSYRMFMVFPLLGPLLVGAFRALLKPIHLIIPLLLAPTSWKSYKPEIHDPNYALLETVGKKAHSHLKNQPFELMIAPNVLAEVYTYTFQQDAMPWLPDYSISPSKLWRLATHMRAKEVNYFSGDSSCMQLPGNYVLLPESDWQSAINNARKAGDTTFVNKALLSPNPSKERPSFLR